MAQCFTCKSDVSQSETSDLQGSRVVPCGQTDGWTNGQTDMTKLVVAFRNFQNAPNVRNGLFALFHGALNIHLRQP